ncbi:PaaI family thioesterase [Pyrococcus abyssi]|uniref:Initiation factor EIf-2b alpha subunit 1 n=1 Tax=Pyrococcus abyssi (strain GE5 / Orsay) TaxID=272844 RepID=Q9UZR6_PYRAB|nr:PaaI family thioesterase [Pyrococcus abyssi]CAB49990.1 paaI related protein, phenylacetic acid degradation-related protein [Pyrococcus abyssi GE5]CCE70490.1 TPA: initiation factor EIf-2b alpha subunit 1 [Pyrococcus abyssi GE5]
MEQRTHKLTSERLVGRPIKIEEGYAEVELVTIDEMKVDEKGLVHGGFTFGLADYAAMLAVNEPTVVLGKAEVRFTKPVKVGDKLVAKAKIIDDQGRKKTVDVKVYRGEDVVLEGKFHCYVLEKHVLD